MAWRVKKKDFLKDIKCAKEQTRPKSYGEGALKKGENKILPLKKKS